MDWWNLACARGGVGELDAGLRDFGALDGDEGPDLTADGRNAVRAPDD
jgi:hypothetical protein